MDAAARTADADAAGATPQPPWKYHCPSTQRQG